MKVFGNYIVASGKELKVRPTHRGYFQWHVTNKYGILMGSYDDESLATLCAKGLDHLDHWECNEEMDKILRSSDEA